MTKQEQVMKYFKKNFEDDDTTYYVPYPGYCSLFNGEVSITVIQIEKSDGTAFVSDGQSDSDAFTESDWDLVSVHKLTEVVGATE